MRTCRSCSYVMTPAAQSAPHYVMTRHYHHPSVFLMNKALFDGLKPALREEAEVRRCPMRELGRASR